MENLSNELINVEIPAQELDEVITKALKKGQRYLRFKKIKQAASVTVLTIVAAMIWTNICPQTSLAAIITKAQNAISSKLFGDGNKAIEIAVQNGYFQPSSDVVSNNGTEVQLTNYLLDSTKLALSFNVKLDNPKLLDDNEGFSMDIDIMDDRGKSLNLPSFPIISSSIDNFEILNKSKGLLHYNFIGNSPSGTIPELKQFKININSIRMFTHHDTDDYLLGNWSFVVNVNDKFKNVQKAAFNAENTNTNLKIINAEASPTGTLLRFAAPKDKQINVFKDLFLVDGLGNTKSVTGVANKEDYGLSSELYSVNFPITTFDNPKSLTLKVKNYFSGENLDINMNRVK